MKLAAPAAMAAAVVITPLAGFGWLYALHRGGVLGAGPAVHEALPLQRLAGGAAQAATRLLLAWLPAGVVAGMALRRAGWRRRWVRAAVLFVACGALLMLMGAAADAVTASEPFAPHLQPQLGRDATWLAAALVAAGAALP
jgi:hypothetical protein